MATPIPPTSHKITLEEGVDLTTRYRESKQEARTPTLVFNREAFDRILKQPGCVAVRLYPCLHADGKQNVVVVGVDEKGSDMTQGELSQIAMECPPICDPDSALMGAK